MIEILMSDAAERCKGIHHFKGKPLQMIIPMVPSITSRLSKKDISIGRIPDYHDAFGGISDYTLVERVIQ